MMMARRAAGRVLVPLAQQIMLSVIGTIAATLVITAVEQGSPSFRDTTVARPELTSGGKFAARAAAVEADDDMVALPVLPLLPPLRALAAIEAGERPGATDVAVGGGVADHKPVLDVAKPARRTARTDTRHHPIVEAVRDIVPPRRADYVAGDPVTASQPSAASAIEADSTGGLWSSTKLLVSRTATYGNALIDHLMP